MNLDTRRGKHGLAPKMFSGLLIIEVSAANCRTDGRSQRHVPAGALHKAQKR
jgi:hypothetical protein